MDSIRKIGVEIEFSGLAPLEVARLVSEVYGGEVKELNSEEVEIDTPKGLFKVETDSRFIKKMARSSKANEAKHFDFKGLAKDLISPLSQEIIPTELVAPPLSFSEMSHLQQLFDKLELKGAEGTQESLRYAFALQLNPEVKERSADYIRRILQSFILLNPWLRDQIEMDLSRKATFFVDEYPAGFGYKILQRDYAPDMERLIDDYLKFNPTRNRDLDLLPLLATFDEQKVRGAIGNEKLKPRPAFHYRLPNSMLGLKSWSLEVELSRWNLVEGIAESGELLEKMKERFLALHEEKIIERKSRWLSDVNNYVEYFRSQT